MAITEREGVAAVARDLGRSGADGCCMHTPGRPVEESSGYRELAGGVG